MGRNNSDFAAGVIPVFRGIKANEINWEAGGRHWSTEKSVAGDFARFGRSRIIIEGTVSPDDVAAGKEKRGLDKARDTRSWENEIPIKPGAEVKVHKVTRERDREAGTLEGTSTPKIKTRRRTTKYDTPRSMPVK
jgi:hypothetical protein